MKQNTKLWFVICAVLILVLALACEESSDDDASGCKTVDAKCGDTIKGETSGSGSLNGYKNSSWNMSGGEVIYKVPVNEDENYVLRVQEISADFEADYFILRECDKALTAVAFGDKDASACLEPGIYFVVVDGRDGANGNFEIKISCTPCGEEDGDDDPDGDEPDGDDNNPPDGDEDSDTDSSTDGDIVDGDTSDTVSCEHDETRCNGNWVQICSGSGVSWGNSVNCELDGKICQNGACVDVADGDTDSDTTDTESSGKCGCTCDEEGKNCTGYPMGTTFTSENCTGWGDDTKCSGWFSTYCVDMCGDNQSCSDTCHDDLTGSNPPETADGTTTTGYGCSITIHCP